MVFKGSGITPRKKSIKMASAHSDRLHHAPDKAKTALLLIDVINDLEFDDGEQLLTHALPMAVALSSLKGRAKAAGIPAIYVNDNFGRWRSDFAKLVRHCLEQNVRGRPVATQLTPEEDDYFVLKPKHSAFFQTNLQILLDYLGATTLILTGMAGDICVLFSANDAYMRDFEIVIPSDCVASEEAESNHQALLLMQRVLKAKVTPSNELEFGHTKVIFRNL
jgi:nicotinamidase-related amidase